MIKHIALFTPFLFITWIASAQKLLAVQQGSLRVPANVKIDAKLTEWGQLQAYNKSTDIFYSLANDDATLYLVLQATDATVINKIIRGGITFAISTSGKRTDKGAISIRYPIIDEKYSINLFNRRLPEKTNDTVTYQRRIDSALYAYNHKLNSDTKTIGIEGVKDITDSVISVYNEEGIKARSAFDRQLNFVYELALPLKYLGLSVTKPATFSYHITLNGIIPKTSTVQTSGKGMYLIVTSANGTMSAVPNRPQYTNLVYPTDFWGEYRLAK